MSMMVPTQGSYEANRRLYSQGESYTIWDALRCDDVVTVESFIKDYNLNPNEPNQQGDTLAFIASKSGAYQCLKLLISLEATVSEKELNVASENNHYDCVQLLLNFLDPGQQKNSACIEGKKISYEATSQIKKQIQRQKKFLERQQELTNQLMLKQQEEAMSNAHDNKGDVGIIYILKTDELKVVIKSYLSAKDLKVFRYVSIFFRSCFEIQTLTSIKIKKSFSCSLSGRLSKLGNKEKQEKVGQLPCESKKNEPKFLVPEELLANDDTEKLGTALKNRLNPNKVFADGVPLVFLAAKNNSVNCLQLLINAKADINRPENEYGRTPAYVAVQQGHDKCLKLLTDAKADINRPNKDGFTPAYIAAEKGQDECLKLLIDAKADINRPENKFGITPAWIAAERGQDKCLQFLIDAEADINQPSKRAGTPAWAAAQKGQDKCLKLLIDAKADINRPNEDGFTPTYIAAEKGQDKCLKLLIDTKADINRPNEDGFTPAYIAAEKGQDECLKLLIDAKADINRPDKNGATPTYIATKQGQDKCLKLLIDAKADINRPENEFGITPAWIAAGRGQDKCLKLLIDAKADINQSSKKGAGTPAWVAAQQGQDKCLKLLIDAKTDINQPGKYSSITLAWIAACHGQNKCLKLLIDAKADINKPNKDGQTPAWIAAERGQDKCLQLLIDVKADINKPNKDGQAPAWIAAGRGQDKCLKLLIDVKTNINRPDKNGTTLAWIAAQQGRGKCLKLLIDAKADINKSNKDGQTPAWIAAERGQDKCLNLLIDAKADINKPNKDGQTPAWIAAGRGQDKCLKLLIDVKADINRPDKNGTTLAWIAAQQGQDKCLQLLIDVKADINKPNKDGQTPAWVATERGQDKCLELLIDAKVDINRSENECDRTLAWVTAQQGQDKCLKLLIAAKADINKPNRNGTTPAWVAAQQGQDKCLKLLIDAKADINRPNKNSAAPAYVATHQGRDKCLKLLIDAKIDINRPDKNGATLAWVAAQQGQDKCLKLLIDAKIDINRPDKNGATPAWIAAGRGQDKCLQILIDAKADINRPNKNDATLAWIATHQGRDKCLKLLIDAKTDINRPNKNDATLAWIAAQQGRDKCLKLLIDAKTDINRPDKNGATPAWVATERGQDKCLKLLIDAKADINQPNKYGGTPAWIAACRGQDKCLKLLIDAKVDINRSENECDRTLAWVTAQQGQDKCLKLLIAAKADINKPNRNGATPAWVAAQQGQDKCLKLLIDAKADINQPSKGGENPAWIAAGRGQDKCLKLLIDAKADINRPNKNGAAPAYVATHQGRDKCLKLLIDTKADINRPDKNGATLAWVAAQQGQDKCLKLLIDVKVDINKPNKDGQTLAWIAAQSGQDKCLQLLIDTKADINKPNKDGQTPTWIATQQGQDKCLKLLIDAKVDINKPNKDGQTLAWIATQSGQDKCLQLLIDAKADINKPNKDGIIPAYVAAQNGQDKCLELLIAAKADLSQLDQTLNDPKFLKNYEVITALVHDDPNLLNSTLTKEADFNKNIVIGNNQYSLIQYGIKKMSYRCLPILIEKIMGKATVSHFMPMIQAFQSFSLVIPNADRIIALSKKLQEIDEKQLKRIDDKEEISLVRDTLEPIRKTYSLPNYLLPVYFECPVTSSFLLEKLKAPFKENSKEWKTLISVAKQTYSMKEFPYQIQKYLLQMKQNEAQFEKMLTKFQNGNSKLQKQHELEKRRLFLRSIESASIEFPFLNAKRNLRRNIQNIPLNERDFLTTLAQKLKFPHQLLQPGSFLASLFYNIYPKSREFTTLNALITEIEVFLRNQNYQPVHRDLASIKDHYQNFIKDVCAAKTEQEKTNLTSPKLPIIYRASAYPRLLNAEAQRLLLVKKEKNNTQYGTHFVQSYNGIHWKQDPHAPGVEYMVHSLNTLIKSSLSPITELVKIKQGQSCFIYQTSQTIEGESLDFILRSNPRLIDKIDPHNFSSMCTLGLIIDPQDAKPDNYMAKLIVNTKKEVVSCSLVGIDNDIAFVNPIIENSNKSHSIDVKNVLYFFPQMKSPIDPTFKKAFCNLCPEITVIKWLKSLYKKNEKYEELYKQSIFTRQELKNLKLPIRLVPNFAQNLTQKLHLIKKTMLNKKDLTHNELFAKTHPILYKYYRDVKIKHKNPLEATKSLYRRSAETVEEKLSLTTKITSRSKLQTAIAMEKAKKWDFEDHRKEEIKTALENFIKEVNFKTLTTEEQQQLFFELADCPQIEHLTIRSSNAFDKNIIEHLRNRLPNLKSLTLDRCDYVTQEDLLHFVTSPSLQRIQLVLGKNRLLKRNQWNFLTDRFENFHLQIPKTKKLIPVNKVDPNLLLQQMIISCPEEKEMLLFALEQRDVDPNALAPENSPLKGKNALHLAASYNLLELLKLLVDHGGDITVKDYSGKTPLDRALAQDKNGSHQEMIDYLIKEVEQYRSVEIQKEISQKSVEEFYFV